MAHETSRALLQGPPSSGLRRLMAIPEGYELVRGRGRCTMCGFHEPTQGHRDHCPNTGLPVPEHR